MGVSATPRSPSRASWRLYVDRGEHMASLHERRIAEAFSRESVRNIWDTHGCESRAEAASAETENRFDREHRFVDFKRNDPDDRRNHRNGLWKRRPKR